MKNGEIAKLTSELANKLVCLSLFLSLSLSLFHLFRRINSAGLAFDGARILSDPLKHYFVRLSQRVDARLQRILRPAMDRMMDIQTDNHGSSGTKQLLISDVQQPTATLLILDHIPFQTLSSLLFHRLLKMWRAFHPFLKICLIFRSYSRTQAQGPTSRGRWVPFAVVFRSRRQTLPLFLVLCIFDSIDNPTLDR